jgi:hypothetical protein
VLPLSGQQEHIEKDAKTKQPDSKTETPKEEIPPWKKEFLQHYGLAEGEVLKRVAPPFPDCRKEFLRSIFPMEPLIDQFPPNYLAFWVHPKHTKGEPQKWGLGQEEATVGLISLMIARIDFFELEGEKKLLRTVIGGDFVFREEASVEKRLATLEKILRDECNLAVKMTFHEVEREVLIAQGTLEVKPLEGRKKNHVELIHHRTVRGA